MSCVDSLRRAPTGTPETHITTNAQFLAAVFRDLDPAAERPMVVGIPGRIDARTHWPRGAAWAPGAVDTSVAAQNWYFTLSTYRPAPRWRRVKAQFARAYGVYLDDTGTAKTVPLARLDACPPSYLVETSPGNFQAGYLFDEPCADRARVESLQNALVAAGLCDPAAKGPSTRLGRMPFAINGKYEPAPACRLAAWHPERRYSIEQIIDGLDLVPVTPAGQRPKPERDAKRTPRRRAAAIDRAEEDVYRPRAAENAVVTALRQRGLYKAPLGAGRHDITCPWVHEHTNQVDHGSAYFEPSDLYPVGGFKCQHSHGDGKRVGALLEFLGVTYSEAKHKPTIRVQAGELHRVVDAAERELAASGRYYQRGGLIVTVATDPGTEATAIKPMTANGLLFALSGAATWQRWDARSAAFVSTDPPARHVTVLADGQNYVHLPVLRGIARQPYLRDDGTLALRAGYDPASHVFGAFVEGAYKVKAEPTQGDARLALAELRTLLEEFRFAEPHDEAAALALLLTAAIRPALPVAPMGHIKAPLRASGKSYLQSLIAAFAGPGGASAYPFPTNEEECAKLLLAALAEAPAALCFDNLTTDLVPFKTLCSALTEEFITGRLLGFSKTITVPTATMIVSSGNNVDAIKDMARRVVTVNLDPRCERPENLEYRGNPVDAARRDRGRYVSAALTVVRAYHVAGRPDQRLKALGSYGAWSLMCRAPLVWLGLPDPALAVFAGLDADPERELLGRLLDAWHRAFNDRPASVRDAVARVMFGTEGDSELAEVLREVAEEKGQINRRRLGRWLARHAGRIVGGMKITRDTPAGGAERWKVVMWVSGVSVGPPAGTVRHAEPRVTIAAEPQTEEPAT